MKDAAFLIVDGHEHGFVATGFFEFCGVAGGGEDGHVFGGAAEVGVAFVGGVEPKVGQAFGDGVVLVPHGDEEFVLRAVLAAGAGGGVADELAFVVIVNIGAVFFVSVAPAAEADHEVKLHPIWPAIIGGMDDDEAAAVGHVLLEAEPGGRGPCGGFPPEVADHDLVFGEVGMEVRIRLRFGGFFGVADAGEGEPCGLALGLPDGAGAGDVDGEEAGVFQVLAHHDRRFRPDVVVVLAVDDEGFQLFSGGRGESRGGEKKGEGKQAEAGHGGGI